MRILVGDCLELLSTLPEESVHCVVTSPPYWGLRDYGMEDAIGLEPTFEEHIETLVTVFREVRRVLRKDGTCWLNCGDSYAGGGRGGNPADSSHRKQATNRGSLIPPSPVSNGLKPKDLLMMPARVALAFQADGWWLRSEIIWHKPNPMPESVRDRPTSAHEKVYLLTKSARYFYDAEAVRVPMAEATLSHGQWKTGPRARHRANCNESAAAWNPPKSDKQRGHSRRHAGFNDRWDALSKEGQQATGANLRNVWTIPTFGFPGAHFATFPTKLVEPCIKAGCPEGGTVLDPFGGAGTVGLVADRLGRDAILIELNPDYAQMAERRIHGDAPLLADVGVRA